jgi:hypothetical protein
VAEAEAAAGLDDEVLADVLELLPQAATAAAGARPSAGTMIR